MTRCLFDVFLSVFFYMFGARLYHKIATEVRTLNTKVRAMDGTERNDIRKVGHAVLFMVFPEFSPASAIGVLTSRVSLLCWGFAQKKISDTLPGYLGLGSMICLSSSH